MHFEVIGKDGAALQSFYSDLFGWKFDANNPMNYGIVQREEGAAGIGGGIGSGPEGYPRGAFFVGVPDRGHRAGQAESLGGSRGWAPRRSWKTSRSGCSTTRRGT